MCITVRKMKWVKEPLQSPCTYNCTGQNIQLLGCGFCFVASFIMFANKSSVREMSFIGVTAIRTVSEHCFLTVYGWVPWNAPCCYLPGVRSGSHVSCCWGNQFRTPLDFSVSCTSYLSGPQETFKFGSESVLWAVVTIALQYWLAGGCGYNHWTGLLQNTHRSVQNRS